MIHSKSEILLPPEGAPADFPVLLKWSGQEYDAFIEPASEVNDLTLAELRSKLLDQEVVSGDLSVIDRGDGRINIIPAGYQPEHQAVIQAIGSLFIKEFES